MTTAWLEKGQSCAGDGKHHEAVDAFTRAIEINPQDVRAYYARGNSHFHLQQFSLAIADYDQAIRMAPDTADFYLGRAFAHYLPDDRKAVEDYDNDPTIPVYRSESVCGAYEKAIADYSKFIDLTRNRSQSVATAHYYRGLSYGRSGDFARALADISKAAALGDEDAQNYMKAQDRVPLLIECFKAGNLAGCIEIARESLKYDDDHFITLCYYGRSLLLAGKNQEAMDIFDRCLSSRREYAFLLSFRGDAEYRLGYYTAAAKDYMRAFNLELKKLFLIFACPRQALACDKHNRVLSKYQYYFDPAFLQDEIQTLTAMNQPDLHGKIIAAELKDVLSRCLSHDVEPMAGDVPDDLSRLDHFLYYLQEAYDNNEVALFRRAMIHVYTKFGVMKKGDNIVLAKDCLQKVIDLNPANDFAAKTLSALNE